ncbi:MAG: BsuBI/PstI family type II restriction endonuclease [Woeseiaceae bacterium]
MAGSLPPIPRLTTLARRLPRIFPEGVSHRSYCIRDVAARTIWVMFYVGAVEGQDRWLRPSMVTDMSDRQAALRTMEDRERWYAKASSPDKSRPPKAWFAPNSREQIRDETIRLGLIPNGAVIERKGLPTTSPLPKYALTGEFANLFDEALTGKQLEHAMEQWRATHLTHAAQARIALIKKGLGAAGDKIVVNYSNGHSRSLAPGPSSVLSKAVIEEFAPRYLEMPAVLWLSESASKVREYDQDLARTLNLQVDPAKDLPDIILIDLGRSGGEILVVFVEVVATDGPVNERRKAALLDIARAARFEERNVAFLTVFSDRGSPSFRKSVTDLALGSFTWFMAEPDSLMILRDGKPVPLSSLR